MYDTKGKSYWVWRVYWRAVWLLSFQGEFGLERPSAEWEKKNLPWWRDNLYYCCRRALSDGVGGVASILLSVLGVAIVPVLALIQAGFTRYQSLDERILVAFVGSAGLGSLLVITAMYAAYLSLRTLPPNEFGRLVLASHSASGVLKILAWEVRVSCSRFEDAMKRLQGSVFDGMDLQRDPSGSIFQEAVSRVGEQRESILMRLEEFRGDVRVFDRQLDRLIVLKSRAAAVLGVPPRRFCDHVVQYSPRLQQKVLQKFAENWVYFLLVSQRGSGEEMENARRRFVSLARENARILRRTKDRIKLAERLFDYSDLHDCVEQVANPLSSSDATLAYARGLSAIADSAPVVEGEVDCELVERRLNFLARKQRAHAGLEPHEACVQIVELIVEHRLASELRPPYHDEMDPGATALTQSLVLQLSHGRFDLRDGAHDAVAAAERISARLAALKELGITAELYFEWSRREIARKFSEKHRDWLSNHTTPVAVVTCDYSRTVRECLKSGLASAGASRPMIYLVSTSDPEHFGSQYMLYELRDDPIFKNRVAIGSAAQIGDLLSDCKRVIVVLGAEAVGPSGQIFVNPEAGRHVKDLLELVKGLPDLEHRLVFVAGHYKTLKRPIVEEEKVLEFHLTHLTRFLPSLSAYEVLTDRHAADQSEDVSPGN